MRVRFDANKSFAVKRKHGVSFKEAHQIFAAEARDRKPEEKRCPVCGTGHMILIQVFRTERLDS